MAIETYVLITAARNEGPYIGKTIGSVVRQTILPLKWVIVSDGSTDSTDEIVRSCASRHTFIEFVRRRSDCERPNFASKVHAFHEGYRRLNGLSYQFIGNLDADITFDAAYYEEMIARFRTNPSLGIAGGFIYESIRGRFRNRPTNRSHSVAGAIQLFRRECFEAAGGLYPLEVGGEDAHAEIMARMAGWQVQAFPGHVVFHHKSGGSVRGFLRENIRQGYVDRALGSHPLFEIAKCVRRAKGRPYVLGAFFHLTGYILARFWRDSAVDRDTARYVRQQQLNRIYSILFGRFGR
jgi:glycosyltransferase involved in cell wall biosynthesis